MSDVWEPVGPLPAHVYWRRRWAALACALSLFVVLGLAVGALTAPGREPAEAATTHAANTSVLVATAVPAPRQVELGPAVQGSETPPSAARPADAPPPAAGPAEAPPSPAGPTEQPTSPVAAPADLPGTVPPGSGGTASGTGTAGLAATPPAESSAATGPESSTEAGPEPRRTGPARTSPPAAAGPSAPPSVPERSTPPAGSVLATEPADGIRAVADTADGTPRTEARLRPDDTPRPAVPVPGVRPSPPSGPPPCTNEMIDVTAEIDGAEHPVGTHPLLRMVVVNVSDQACVRDLAGALLEVVVWDPSITHRFWSSNDCVDPSTNDLRTLLPGQPVAFVVRWAGFTSNPGCTAPRTPVPAGEYRVMSRVADRISAPTRFRLA